VGQAFYLSGDMHVRVPSFAPLNQFTIEGWVAPENLAVSTSVPIFEQWNSTSNERLTVSLTLNTVSPEQGSIEVTWVDGAGTHQFSTAPDAVYFNWHPLTGNSTFHHIAITFDALAAGDRIQLYHNGVLVASGGLGASIQLGASDLCFGFSPSSSTDVDYFTGKLDELSLYNRPLSQAEILDIYNASVAGKTPLCTSAPADLVAWWEGQNNGADVFAVNPATVQGGVTFTRGLAKQAFTFNGAAQVRVPASASLDVGSSVNGFTIEAWVNPASIGSKQPLVVWNTGYLSGVALWLTDQGELAANIPTLDLIDNWLWFGGALTPGMFQHIVLTYEPDDDDDDNYGEARLFLNGNELGMQYCYCPVETPLTTQPFTTSDLYLGYNPADDLGETGTQFSGQLDEVSLFSRALSASEIQALYAAGGGGKCGIAPQIVSQPVSQTANAGETVVLEVSAIGTSLTYEWSVGGVVIPGATTAKLTLANLQAGNYTFTVRVANDVDDETSSPATVNVMAVLGGTAPVIQTQPVSQSACAGGTVSLSVSATVVNPARYQWRKNGVNIPGATVSTYSVSSASVSDTGTYTVTVYDSQGHVTSAPATIMVYPRPTALVAGDTQINPGLFADLWVVLSGTPPWTITWSDGPTESGVTDNPHRRSPPVSPSTTTDYSVTAVSDAHCAALPADISGTAHVEVSGPSILPTVRGGVHTLVENMYNDFTFAGDMTYYIDHTIRFTGQTKIEGGTVVKFAPDSLAKIVIENNNIVCDTGPYRPAIFTGRDNDNHGYYRSEIEPAGFYGSGISLEFTAGAPVTLKNLRFFNLGKGVSIDGAGTFNFYNCQFADCDTAISQAAVTANINLYNILFTGNTTAFAPDVSSTPNLLFQHITVDSCNKFVWTGTTPPIPTGSWQGANSLLINVSASIPGSFVNVGNTCKILASSTGVFHTGTDRVDGNYYLSDSSTYRAAGTTSINSTLLNELPQKTTRPPLFISWFGLKGSITLSPQVPRCSSSAPDIGYCYDALDYVLAGVFVLNGGQLEILPGTVVGFSYDWVLGLDLWEGSSIVAKGTASKPITFVPTTAVQEGPYVAWWPGMLVSFIPDYWPNEQNSPPPVVDFRFCNFYQSSGICHHFWGGRSPVYFGDMTMSATSVLEARMQDCQFRSGWVNLGEPHSRVITPVDWGGEVIPGSVLWQNNLFDRVNINLDPDTGTVHWGPREWFPNPTVDLQLLATNNTFRGGFLAMAPVPASEGSWVFENNLFDKVVFAQDANLPLDFDYNAYWPCRHDIWWPEPGAELIPGQTWQLNVKAGDPVPVNEVTLANAPPYEFGPLGGFYLGTSSPLENAGRGLPKDAGLFHYTTRVDQTKDAGNVDIGFHYIATANSGSTELLDSDTDGIPDYVEDADGDNDSTDVAEGRETSPTDSQTVDGTADSVNMLYDNVDLDGDGLVGRIEEALDLDPLTSANPFFLTQVQPVGDPQIAEFDIPLLLTQMESMHGQINLRVNGFQAVLHETTASPGGNCRFLWNTAFDAPGRCYLQVEFILEGRVLDASVRPAFGILVPFDSQNVIQLFETSSMFDEAGGFLDASLAAPNATYTIDLYDPMTTPATHIRTIGPNITADGWIQEDITASDVAMLSGTMIEASYDVTLKDNSGATIRQGTAKRRMGRPTGSLNDFGRGFNFVYTYAPMSPNLEHHYREGGVNWIAMQSVVNVLLVDNGLWVPYESGFNRVKPDPKGEYPGYIDSQSTVDEKLIPSMGSGPTRQFYYLGHSEGASLANGYNDVRIYSSHVAGATGFTRNTRTGLMTVERPYRFVFIDGCKSDPGSWTRAFGILGIEPNLRTREKVGPQAFVGWKGDRPTNYRSTDVMKAYAVTLNAFFTYWMSGKTLNKSIKWSCDPSYLEYPLPIPSNKRVIINGDKIEWVHVSEIYVVGHSGLTVDGHVHDECRKYPVK